MPRAVALLVIVAVGCAATPDPVPGTPATTTPVTTSPVSTAAPTTSPPATAPPTTSVVTTSPVTTSDTATPSVPPQLDGLARATITIGDVELLVAVADTREARGRGLMFVDDLGDLDGMLFVFESERSGSFWMKDTLIDLDIAWFDDAGVLVGATTMVPCVADPCPSYDPGAPFRYAVEAPAGDLSFVDTGTGLVVP